MTEKVDMRFVHEHVDLAAEARRVVETDDAWTIPDSVLTRSGVVNGILRTWKEAIAPFGLLWEGQPVVYPHPAGDILEPGDLRMVGGQVRHVRLDHEKERVVVDIVLYKRSIPGFHLSAEALAHNAETVKRFRAGARVESSPGYRARHLPHEGTHEGQEYRLENILWVPNHHAILGVGENEDRGGCNWGMQCGLGRAQGEHHRDPHSNGVGSPTGDPNMPDCGTECATRKSRLEAHDTALKELGALVGIDKDASCQAITARVTELKQEYDRLFATEGVEKDRLAKECAEAKVALNKDLKGKEADLVKELKQLPTPALREVHGAFAAARAAREGKSRTDSARVAGGQEQGRREGLIDVWDKTTKTWKQVDQAGKVVPAPGAVA